MECSGVFMGDAVLVHTRSALLRKLPVLFAKGSLYEPQGPFMKYSAVREASAPYGKHNKCLQD